MSAPLLTFKRGAGDVVVDLETLLETRLLIQASSGAGKSWMIRYLLEQTHGRVQHIVIDREGDFVSLREKFPYLLVGPEGDLPADRRAAKLLARKLLELKASAILDLSEMTPEQQREYVATFSRELAHLPREYWSPCLVVIDEAHLFAPQKRKSEATSPVEELTSLGRKRGYCVVLATQRLAKLDKDVAGECLNKLIGRVSDIDAKRAGEELEFDKKGAKELRSLEPGEFWAYGPAIATDPVKVKSGAIETVPPKRGELRPPAPPPTAKIRSMLEQLRDLPQQAAEEVKSIAQLKKDNAELRAKLTRAEKHGVERVVEKKVVDQDAIAKAVDRALRAQQQTFDRALVALLRQHGQVMRPLAEVVRGAESLGVVQASLRGLQEQIEALRNGGAKPPDPASTSERVRPAAPPRQLPAPRPTAGADVESSLGTGEQKILNAMAELEALGLSPVTRAQAGAVAGYTLNGGTGGNYVGRLVSRGLLAIPAAGSLALTDEGRALAAPADVPLTNEEAQRRALEKLGTGERRILEHLISIWPEAQTRTDAGEAVGYTLNGGTGGNYVGRLTTLQFVEIPAKGMLRAADLLFPEDAAMGARR